MDIYNRRVGHTCASRTHAVQVAPAPGSNSYPSGIPVEDSTMKKLVRPVLATPSMPESDRLCLGLSLPTGGSADVECVVRNTRRSQKGGVPILLGVEFALIEPGTKAEIDFFLAASELRRRAKR